MLFIKIAVSFTSLIPCLVLPRELRETTEGTPKEDHMTKKALFLRLSPKKVDFIPEKVDPVPKKVAPNPKIVNSIPKSVVLSTRPLNKNHSNSHFYLVMSKKCCIFALENINANS